MVLICWFLLKFEFELIQFECLDICKSNSNCTWFTYFPHSDFCNLFANCTAIEDEFCSDCISGEQACLPPEPICWVIGKLT